MKKKNITNLLVGTALVSAAAYVAYKMYKKSKKENKQEDTIYERHYTVLSRNPLPEDSESIEEEKAKVM